MFDHQSGFSGGVAMRPPFSHSLFGCPCCAEALPALLETGNIDLRRQADAFRSRPDFHLARVAAGECLLVNARIMTMDPDMSEADALLIRDGRVIRVGSTQDARSQATDDALVVDCQGRTLLPGFIEPHMHLVPIAVLHLYENVGPFRYPSVEEALQRLREVAAETAHEENPEAWVVGRQFDPSLQAGPSVLTRQMLDTVSETLPVFVYNASLHLGYCNTRALEIAGITRDTPDPPGSRFERDSDGMPNGVLQGGGAMGGVARHNAAMRAHDISRACLDVFAHANAVGFTTVCDQGTGLMQGAGELELYRALRDSNAMTCRFRYSLGDQRAEDWDRSSVAFGDGDSWLRAAGWKIVSDGSNQGLTGLQREPFLCADSRGIAYVEPEALKEKVATRLDQGWPVVVHANGDQAIDNVLEAFEAARAAGLDPAAARCRIEHCSILHDEQIVRIRDLGLSPSFLIGHVYWWGQAFRDEIFGPEKAAKLDRAAACETAGIRWTIHSDEPVTEMNPLRCIENAVTRTLWRDPDNLLAPDEAVPVEVAIRAMTRDAAWQCHSDHEVGSLEPGKLADFVILDADPRKVKATDIGKIRVLETWVGGVRVFQADDREAI
jgi:predicted amidohydrolase YtcJ